MQILNNPTYKSKLLDALATAKEIANTGSDRAIVMYSHNERYNMEFKDNFVSTQGMRYITEVLCNNSVFTVNCQRDETSKADSVQFINLKERTGSPVGMLRDGTYVL